MTTSAYLTSYNGLVCQDCADHPSRTLTEAAEADLRAVFGYDRACCEECKTVLYDGLAAPV